jgi:hypothetical protein
LLILINGTKKWHQKRAIKKKPFHSKVMKNFLIFTSLNPSLAFPALNTQHKPPKPNLQECFLTLTLEKNANPIQILGPEKVSKPSHLFQIPKKEPKP